VTTRRISIAPFLFIYSFHIPGTPDLSWRDDTCPGFQPFGFQGGLYDRDTGLVRFGARDYDPIIGRWLTKDPLGFEAGINFYAFCGNDPVNKIDPFGFDDLNLSLPGSLAAQAINSRGTYDDVFTIGSEGYDDGSGPVDQRSGGSETPRGKPRGIFNAALNRAA
jgi:RHS repeat-associated protein